MKLEKIVNLKRPTFRVSSIETGTSNLNFGNEFERELVGLSWSFGGEDGTAEAEPSLADSRLVSREFDECISVLT